MSELLPFRKIKLQYLLEMVTDGTELKTCTLAGTPVICIKVDE